ncbi:MAG: type II toxin-antitoxin system death-on-curing family toxin [Dehalococcoidia bacterium]
MPIWYPDREDVEIVARELAAIWFPRKKSEQPALFGLVKGHEGRAALESALGIVQQPYYRQLHDKAGALLRSLIKNHAFVDGNKRIAVITTIDFLSMNGHILYATDEELVDEALRIARSEPDTPWKDVARWIRERCYCARSKSPRVRARLLAHPKELQDRLLKMRKVLQEIMEDDTVK